MVLGVPILKHFRVLTSLLLTYYQHESKTAGLSYQQIQTAFPSRPYTQTLPVLQTLTTD